MKQNTTLSKSIDIIAEKAKYDAACKKVLAEKIILAWIMKHTMKEYQDYPVEEIAEKYIEGIPEISQVPVLPDETNSTKISGTGVEDVTVTEGTITYDIRFRAILPVTKEHIGMIINVEAQNDFYPGYPIVKRGIYYCGRMISAQYGTVFTKSHYEKLQKVYSIWICMKPPTERKNSITEYSFIEKNRIGNVKEAVENYDLMTTILICLGSVGECEDNNDLIRMLDVLLSEELPAKDKKEILEQEYQIPMTEEMEEEVEQMCNLSDGVEQRGIEKGIKIGIQQEKLEIAKNLLDILSDEELSRRISLPIEEVRKLREEAMAE
ncbi:MAG: hypothetical protein II250_01085 [Agathobacter sp.]|nr:hypothetical protein [Agathobacter sp.]